MEDYDSKNSDAEPRRIYFKGDCSTRYTRYYWPKLDFDGNESQSIYLFKEEDIAGKHDIDSFLNERIKYIRLYESLIPGNSFPRNKYYPYNKKIGDICASLNKIDDKLASISQLKIDNKNVISKITSPYDLEKKTCSSLHVLERVKKIMIKYYLHNINNLVMFNDNQFGKDGKLTTAQKQTLSNYNELKTKITDIKERISGNSSAYKQICIEKEQCIKKIKIGLNGKQKTYLDCHHKKKGYGFNYNPRTINELEKESKNTANSTIKNNIPDIINSIDRVNKEGKSNQGKSTKPQKKIHGTYNEVLSQSDQIKSLLEFEKYFIQFLEKINRLTEFEEKQNKKIEQIISDLNDKRQNIVNSCHKKVASDTSYDISIGNEVDQAIAIAENTKTQLSKEARAFPDEYPKYRDMNLTIENISNKIETNFYHIFLNMVKSRPVFILINNGFAGGYERSNGDAAYKYAQSKSFAKNFDTANYGKIKEIILLRHLDRYSDYIKLEQERLGNVIKNIDIFVKKGRKQYEKDKNAGEPPKKGSSDSQEQVEMNEYVIKENSTRKQIQEEDRRPNTPNNKDSIDDSNPISMLKNNEEDDTHKHSNEQKTPTLHQLLV